MVQKSNLAEVLIQVLLNQQDSASIVEAGQLELTTNDGKSLYYFQLLLLTKISLTQINLCTARTHHETGISQCPLNVSCFH